MVKDQLAGQWRAKAIEEVEGAGADDRVLGAQGGSKGQGPGEHALIVPVVPGPAWAPVLAAFEAVGQRAADANVEVVGVGECVGGLMKHRGGALNDVDGLTTGDGMLEHQVFEALADEEPLDAHLGVGEERAGQRPVSLHVEEEGVSQRAALVVEMDQVGGGYRAALGVEGVEGQVDVAAGLVGTAPGDGATALKGNVAHAQRGAAVLKRDALGGALNRVDELAGAEVGVSAAMALDDAVKGPLGGQGCGL